ncbi:FkbM family methyltransferase [Singulisphaera sp. Ch08]|uniref:FkbM family methyltransferase n=1 Tax=Singulisphaera sp. Ch08 TaxID=3120278 RepID=A0AAU7CM18_9BACT
MLKAIVQSLRSSLLVRRIVLPILSKVGRGDITIKHHYTGDPVRLDRFKHRNYWCSGKDRERTTMELFRRILRPGDVGYDVGANIGYISLYMMSLVGEQGRLYAFEPDPSNLIYLRENLGKKAQAFIVEAGVAAEPGSLELYAEDLTGQNSSFIKDFEMLKDNAAAARMQPKISAIAVDVITLDGVLSETQAIPRCIKIDVEGFEFEVLLGAVNLLREHSPILLIEVHNQKKNQVKIFEFLQEAGYQIHCVDTLARLTDPEQLNLNVLCLKPGKHDTILETVDRH